MGFSDSVLFPREEGDADKDGGRPTLLWERRVWSRTRQAAPQVSPASPQKKPGGKLKIHEAAEEKLLRPTAHFCSKRPVNKC